MAQEVLYATGKRKTAVARVWLKPGNGMLRINKKKFNEYVIKESDKIVIMEAFEVTNTIGKYDMTVNVKGGGTSGQAGAIRHGISRAIVAGDPSLREILKKNGFLTRDPRMKERKKYGQPGARAKFQYSKR